MSVGVWECGSIGVLECGSIGVWVCGGVQVVVTVKSAVKCIPKFNELSFHYVGLPCLYLIPHFQNHTHVHVHTRVHLHTVHVLCIFCLLIGQ